MRRGGAIFLLSNEAPLRGYKRFDNPYCQTDFMDPRTTIHCGGQSYTIDLSDAIAVRE